MITLKQWVSYETGTVALTRAGRVPKEMHLESCRRCSVELPAENSKILQKPVCSPLAIDFAQVSPKSSRLNSFGQSRICLEIAETAYRVRT